ncbi:MAG: hypothetical protein JOY95_01990 [Silvibacterium sp.]|nr:hypothetical protein [Silvibacterium sp.]
MRPVTILFLLARAFAFCQPAEGQVDLEKTDREIVRLSPARFPELPPAIRKDLARRGCTIPQQTGEKKTHNVIKGAFIQRGELDWAVLCSVKRISAILVFPNASPSGVISLARRADIDSLQSAGGDRMVYSRVISPVGRDVIMVDYRAYGGPKPPPIDHQGIDDGFAGKGSAVLYFYRGKWLQLTGAD